MSKKRKPPPKINVELVEMELRFKVCKQMLLSLFKRCQEYLELEEVPTEAWIDKEVEGVVREVINMELKKLAEASRHKVVRIKRPILGINGLPLSGLVKDDDDV